VLAPGCPLACHPLHKPYVLLDGDLADIPRIAPGERNMLLNAARTFNEYAPQVRPALRPTGSRPVNTSGASPAKAYNASTDWSDLLEPEGWVKVRSWKGAHLWRRPGKKRGTSAVTGGTRADIFYAWSSNGGPFEPETPYSKFEAYALLHHRGDLQAAAKALIDQGYGERHSSQQVEHPSAPGSTNGAAPFRTTPAHTSSRIRTIAAKEVPTWR
jgi:putative DNA primase/helicase